MGGGGEGSKGVLIGYWPYRSLAMNSKIAASPKFRSHLFDGRHAIGNLRSVRGVDVPGETLDRYASYINPLNVVSRYTGTAHSTDGAC